MVCQVPGWPAGDSFFRSRHPGHLFSRLQACSRCSYFSLVASPPRMWRSALLMSSTTRAWAARAGLMFLDQQMIDKVVFNLLSNAF